MEHSNFTFLAAHGDLFVTLASDAERYVYDDPNAALYKLRLLAEKMAQRAAAHVGLDVAESRTQIDLLNRLDDRGLLTAEVRSVFHGIRKTGNTATHDHTVTQRESFHYLKLTFALAVWFHRVFHNRDFIPHAFTPPATRDDVEANLRQEIEDLRGRVGELTQAAATTEEQFDAQQQAHQSAIEALQREQTAKPAASHNQLIANARRLGEDLAIDEAETRLLIDQQLRDAGWEADSTSLSHGSGARPEKGHNRAIAEWPTAHGPADYVLFAGLTPVAAVEAKRRNRDVAGAIEQAKRYSRDFQPDDDLASPGGPWDDYHIPFAYSCNGRPFLRQLRTKSGTWFRDNRRPTNHPRPLESFHSPQGLLSLLRQDIEAADRDLESTEADYLPLRGYQLDAIRAVESAIADDKRDIMIAMATGTGKTRTCIGLVYRLLKAKRFNRTLFIVDRTALGEQAGAAFKDVKIDQNQAFSEIYDVKELGDITPDPDTRLHICTIQSLIKRVLAPEDDCDPIPVDQYDCIVVDECHRGYNLDRELSDAELTFRDENDYISKYRRVLDHFDAVRIGLTATPALHTTEIFGQPVYTYSYRQAVIDGFLIDHEPPLNIRTRLSDDGITFLAGTDVEIIRPRTGELMLFNTQDDIDLEIDQFNRQVITENFNGAVCKELANHIDPDAPGKTLIFCVTDSHADIVVTCLKEAFENACGDIHDDTVLKITGAADKPLTLYRRFKNEQLPKVAVTVDLLTTGIDVPEITNLVFLRRVRSRILYEQMIGRATRLCSNLHGDGRDKEVFRIFDAVGLYDALQDHTQMKPVVTQPNISLRQLADELTSIDDETARREVKDQITARLQRRRRGITEELNETFHAMTGMDPDDFVRTFRDFTTDEAAAYVAEHPEVIAFIEDLRVSPEPLQYISHHEDEVTTVTRGYGAHAKPQDYLDAFSAWVREHINDIPALLLVTQRPRDLTRRQLRELRLELDRAGFTETALRAAYRDATNHDIAASIIGFIRQSAMAEPLLPYDQRVRQALDRILASRQWTAPQRNWLERIGKQMTADVIVDRDALDHGAFKNKGGYNRINKVFDGRIDDILAELNDQLWTHSA